MASDQAEMFRLGWSLAMVAAAGLCWTEVIRYLYGLNESVVGVRDEEAG